MFICLTSIIKDKKEPIIVHIDSSVLFYTDINTGKAKVKTSYYDFLLEENLEEVATLISNSGMRVCNTDKLKGDANG